MSNLVNRMLPRPRSAAEMPRRRRRWPKVIGFVAAAALVVGGSAVWAKNREWEEDLGSYV
jgi:ferric-dicitrate binding protein FerR (iron transport regulator)